MGDFLIGLIKIFLATLLIPVVIASVLGFQNHLTTYPMEYQDFFLWGIMAFLLVFLFAYQFWGVYEFGQKIMGDIFKFSAPFNSIISYVLPFYFIIIMFLFYATTEFLGIKRYDPYFMFFSGFSLAMHTFLSAQDLQEQEKTPVKPSYLLTICVVVILNIVLMVLFMDLILGKWTFPAFFETTWQGVQNKYDFILHQMIDVK